MRSQTSCTRSSAASPAPRLRRKSSSFSRFSRNTASSPAREGSVDNFAPVEISGSASNSERCARMEALSGPRAARVGGVGGKPCNLLCLLQTGMPLDLRPTAFSWLAHDFPRRNIGFPKIIVKERDADRRRSHGTLDDTGERIVYFASPGCPLPARSVKLGSKCLPSGRHYSRIRVARADAKG